MNSYKVSLILTVKNEEKSIRFLFDSILNQLKKPDEIVIVDGGSTDKTIDIIKDYLDLIPIKLIQKIGANIATGRNIAIANSKYSIIAVTDGGCKLDKKWLDQITKPFKEMDVDVVFGKYIGVGDSLFQILVRLLLVYDFDKIKENSFSPSSRSIAFKREAWEQVNGYPEWLDYAEDTYYNRELKKIGKKFYLNKNAVVYWQMRQNFSQLFKQHLNYAIYDGIGLINVKFYILRLTFWMSYAFFLIYSIITSCFIFISISLILAISIVSFRIIIKLKSDKLSFKRYIYGLLIYFVVEIAKVIGFIYGLLRIRKKRRS